MKRLTSHILPVAALLLLGAGAYAQGPGGFGGPPGGPGGFQMPPGMQAKFQAWRQWRDTHKNVTSLQRTLGALADMEQDPRTRLTKPQAHAVLAVMSRWQGKPALSDEQARQVNAQLTAPLNLTQIKKIALAAQQRGFGGGGRPGGGFSGGGFGGGRPGGPGGGPPAFNPASFPAPRDYNPLNPATNPMARARGRMQGRLASLRAALVATK